VAIVAAARKLAVLFWCLLSRGEDYAHQQPSLTALKLRRLKIAVGAPRAKASPPALGHPRADAPSREAARRAGTDLLRAHRPRLAVGATMRAGASVTAERAESRPSKGNLPGRCGTPGVVACDRAGRGSYDVAAGAAGRRHAELGWESAVRPTPSPDA